MRRPNRLQEVAAVVVAATLILAAGAAQADTPSKAPILIGATSDQSGLIGPIGGLAQSRAIDVWVKWTNDKGGILGHPVVVLNEDTKSDPATGASVLNALLSNPKVVAVVHGGDDTPPGTSVAVANAKAPVIGGLNDEDIGYANANVFPASTTADVAEEIVGFIGAQSRPRQPNGGILYAPEFKIEDTIPGLRMMARKGGGRLVYVEAVSLGTTPDYPAQCRAAQAKDVGWMVAFHMPSTISSLAEACAKVGYTPTWVTVSGVYTPAFLKVPSLDGMKVLMPNALFNGPSPAAQEFLKAVAQYDPDLLAQPYFGEYSIIAWSSMQLVAKAIEQAHPQGGEVTRADVYRGLYSLKHETLGGLAPPLTFHRGQPTTIRCYFTAEIRSGQLVATSTKPDCQAGGKQDLPPGP